MSGHIGIQRLMHYDKRELRGDLIGGVTVTAYLIWDHDRLDARSRRAA